MVHKLCNRWRLKANVSKCAIVVFSQSKVHILVGGHAVSILFHSYCYLGLDFASDGGWDTHVNRVIGNGRKKVNQLHSIRNTNLSTRRQVLLSVLTPSIEYGSEIWKCIRSHASALESIICGEAKKILGTHLLHVVGQLEGT